ncbi:MAG: hypothetical protein ACXW3O_06960 [Brevundimonas sp.]
MRQGVAAVRRQAPAAAAAPEHLPDNDQTARSRSAEECLLKGAELDRRASEAPEGPLRDGFLELAEDWRRLAAANPLLVNLWR